MPVAFTKVFERTMVYQTLSNDTKRPTVNQPMFNQPMFRDRPLRLTQHPARVNNMFSGREPFGGYSTAKTQGRFFFFFSLFFFSVTPPPGSRTPPPRCVVSGQTTKASNK